jgi:hypothetical protein
MITPDFEKLCVLVFTNPDLAKTLQAFTDLETFTSEVLAVAAQANLHIDAQLLNEQINANTRTWIERWL